MQPSRQEVPTPGGLGILHTGVHRMDLPEMSAASNVFVKACVVVRFSLFKINQKHSDLSVQPRARTNWLRSQHRSRHK